MIQRGIEPLLQIRQRTDALSAGKGLVVVASFLSSLLIEKFRSEGFRSKIERVAGADWMVYFWREGD